MPCVIISLPPLRHFDFDVELGRLYMADMECKLRLGYRMQDGDEKNIDWTMREPKSRCA